MAPQLFQMRTRERLAVGSRFLVWRPRIVACGALVNAGLLSQSTAPRAQKIAVAGTFAFATLVFFVEAWWTTRRPLSERWLFVSLVLTLVGIAGGATLSGGIASPFLPLLFAPVTVGFAAFGRTKPSVVLFVTALSLSLTLTFLGSISGFLPLEPPWGTRMLGTSTLTALILVAVGVIGLVDAHARVSTSLERMREDAVAETERRNLNIELLGARVAHEIKNPLTAVRGLVQLVRRKAEDPKDAARLEVVEREVDRALEILADYLGMTKPFSELQRADVAAVALLEEVRDLVEARASTQGVSVVVDADGSIIHVDSRRMRDALLNLALNAIRAMPSGGRLDLVAKTSTNGVTLSVIDQGVGMTEEELATLGEPFVTHAEDGTGLGIAIARGILERHAADLRFESRRGMGTTATLEIPRWQPS